MHRFGFAAVCFLVAITTIAAQKPSARAVEIVTTIRELRSIEIPNFETGQTSPPARVPGLLRRLNRGLKALIIETLNDPARRNTVASAEEIFEQLRAAGWDEQPSHKWNAYGEINDIVFDWKSDFDPGILIVSTQLWIPCGSTDPDAAIYVFRGRARAWKLVLSADADFDTVGGVQQSGVQYELSPPDANGDWYLAVAHAPPSCRSASPNIRYKILRPGKSAEEPLTLLHVREPVNQRFEPPFRIRAEVDWSSLTRGVVRKLDGQPGVAISRYEVGGAQSHRIPPLALTPEDFLDQWVQLDKGQAVLWSSNAKEADLETWHAKLSGLARDSTEFEFVQACPKPRDFDESWLIGLWIDQKLNPSGHDERLYVSVDRKFSSFYVQSVSSKRPAGCPGNTPAHERTHLTLPNW